MFANINLYKQTIQMNIIKVYKLLTYLLAIPTAFIGLFSLFGLLLALLNPILLLPIFILLCVVIYVICSFTFLFKIINAQKLGKKILKDLLKINGIIALAFSVLNIINLSSIIFNPAMMDKLVADAITQSASSFPAGITKEMIANVAWTFIVFMTIFSTVLITHIIISFNLIKRYASSFLA